MVANAMLAFRHIEDAEMRLGRFLRALGPNGLPLD
jgi:hypothetical protein